MNHLTMTINDEQILSLIHIFLEKAERIKQLSDELEKETWELKKLIGNGNISGKLLPSE